MYDFAEQARKALADYLRTELTPAFPTIQVSGVWPQPGKALAPFEITVLLTGAPDTAYWPATWYDVQPDPSPAVTGQVSYSFGRLQLDLQLDLWAATRANRDALIAAVVPLLNRHPLQTLTAPPWRPMLGRHPGVVLPVAALLGMPCDFRFEAAGDPTEDPDAAQANEWRATFPGTGTLYCVAREQVALIKQLEVDWTVNGGPTEPQNIT